MTTSELEHARAETAQVPAVLLPLSTEIEAMEDALVLVEALREV